MFCFFFLLFVCFLFCLVFCFVLFFFMEIMDKNFKATDYYAVNKTHKIKKSRRSLIIFTNMSDSIDCWNNFGYDSGLIFWKRKEKQEFNYCISTKCIAYH